MLCESFVLLNGARDEQQLRVFKLADSAQEAFTDLVAQHHDAWFHDDTDYVEFSPQDRLNSDGVFTVDIDLPSVLKPIIDESPPTVPAVKKKDIPNVRAIIAYDEETICFYAIDSGSRYTPGSGLLRVVLEKDQYEEDKRPALEMPGKLTAAWEDGTLYFKSEWMVRRFLNLDSVFAAATDEQLEEFESNALFVVQKKTVGDLANDDVRRRVTSLLQSGNLKKINVSDVRKYAAKFKVTLTMKGGQIVIPSTRKELHELLDVLEDNLYQGEMTGEKYRATGKRPL